MHASPLEIDPVHVGSSTKLFYGVNICKSNWSISSPPVGGSCQDTIIVSINEKVCTDSIVSGTELVLMINISDSCP